LIWVVAAAADAPDPVDVGSKASPAIEQARVISITAAPTASFPDAVKVTVKGGWLWTTHGSACTDDRAGVGYAVDWNDPIQVGNTVKTISFTENGQPVTENVQVGTAAANALNPLDNAVHPTPSSGTGIETDIEAPAQFSKWRSGCGTVGSGTSNGVNQANLPRGVWGPRRQLFKGNAFGSTTGANTTINESGLSHVFRRRADISRICVITYDVHSGTVPDKNSGVGFPGKASEVTAGGTGHNTDNGAEQNGGTPLGNACPAISNPSIRVDKTPKSQSVAYDSSVTFTITVTNTGDVALSNVSVNDLVAPNCARGGTSGNASLGSLALGQSTSYDCTVPHVTAAFINTTTACGNSPNGENVCDNSTADTDLARRSAAVGIESLGSAQDIKPSDTGTLTITGPTGGTIAAPGGTLTFKLFKGDCDSDHQIYTDTQSIDANGSATTTSADLLSTLVTTAIANGKTVTAGAAGNYQWQITYSGDGNGNAGFTGGCGVEHFSISDS
jgi:uncharacterized repeat protein (TIGR01451 family)